MSWFKKTSESELKKTYMAGFVRGQESTRRLQPEFARALLSRARFIPERLVYEIPQESLDDAVTVAEKGEAK